MVIPGRRAAANPESRTAACPRSGFRARPFGPSRNDGRPQNAFAPVLGCGRSTQPGADGGECLTHHSMIRGYADTRHQMVRRISLAPPPRFTCFPAMNGRPFLFVSRFSPSALWLWQPQPSVSRSLSLLLSLLALPFAAPAFLGLAAFGSAIGSATPSLSTRWAGAGGTGSGSGRSCAGSSLLKATPSSRRPAPDGSVETTPSGSPSSFQASAAASSSSLSLSSTSPAMMASAIRPEFWRTAASILAAMSGFSFKNCLAFSRPCPMRWLS